MNAQALPQTSTTLTRVGAVAAIATGVALITKVTVAVVTAGQVDAAVTGTLYVAGMALPLIAAAGIASALGGGWPKMIAVFGAILLAHAMYVTTLSDGVGALVEQFTDEAYLAVLGSVWLILGFALRRRLDAAVG